MSDLIRVDWIARHTELDASIGKRFGQLVIVSRTAKLKNSRKLAVLARCDCGTEKAFPFHQIENGNTRGAEPLGTETTSAYSAVAR